MARTPHPAPLFLSLIFLPAPAGHLPDLPACATAEGPPSPARAPSLLVAAGLPLWLCQRHTDPLAARPPSPGVRQASTAPSSSGPSYTGPSLLAAVALPSSPASPTEDQRPRGGAARRASGLISMADGGKDDSDLGLPDLLGMRICKVPPKAFKSDAHIPSPSCSRTARPIVSCQLTVYGSSP